MQTVTMASMYVPKAFAVDDVSVLHDFIEEFSFATIVTQRDGELIASHIPFLLDRSVEPYGALRAHVATRNPQGFSKLVLRRWWSSRVRIATFPHRGT